MAASTKDNMVLLNENTKQLPKMDKNFLDLFWFLVENKTDARLNAAVSLVSALQDKQSSIETVDNPDVKSAELEYCVKRLVQGMSSSRKKARLGFCVALTEVLRRFPVITIEDIIKHIEHSLRFDEKQDKSQVVIGQLLTYTAVVRSGRLQNDPYMSFVVLNLLQLSMGKSYIQQSTHELMINLFSQIPEERFKEEVWPHIKKLLSCGWENCSQDALWILLLCLRIYPKSISPKYLNKHWENEDLFDETNLCHWQKIIKQASIVQSQLPPICLEFLDTAIHKATLRNVWGPIIDESLFASGFNEKTYMGFLMIHEALNRIPPKKKYVKSIMSPKFCFTLSKCLLFKNSALYAPAQRLVQFLCEYVKKNPCPDVQIVILKSLLQPPGSTLQIQVLKKVASSMISHLCAEGVKRFYEMLKDLIYQEGSKSGEDESHKPHQAVLQIGSLVSHPAVLSDTNWRMDVIRFLFLHSFFIVTEASTDIFEGQVVTKSFPSSLHQSFAHSFTRALDSLHTKIVVTTSPLQQQLQFLEEIVNFADSLMENETNLKPIFPIEEMKEPWQKMKSLVAKLTKQSDKDGKVDESSAFKLLFLQLGLQLYQDAENILNLMEELEICCKKALKARRHFDDDDAVDQDLPWVKVITDILLSLLSRPSHHLRNVVNSIFPLICQYITKDALQLILDVIDPERANDEEPLLDEDEDDAEEAEFDSGSSSSEHSEEENTTNHVDQGFRLKIQKALGPAADDSDADSDTALTDTEMFKLDDAIAEAFRSRKKTSHTQQTEEQKTLMNFRTRCMDLIAIYLKSGPSLPHALQCIKPVLSAFEFGHHNKHQTPLTEKAASVLKILTQTKNFQKCDEEKEVLQSIDDILNYIVPKIHKEHNFPTASILYSILLFIVLCERKIRLKQSSEVDANLVELESLKKYFVLLKSFAKESSCHVFPQLFISLMNSCPEFAWLFVQPLQKYACDESIRPYNRCQCLGLLQSALRFSKGQKLVTDEMWTEVSTSLIHKIAKLLKDSLSKPDIKPLFVTELMDLASNLDSLTRSRLGNSILVENKELLSVLSSMNDEQIKQLKCKGRRLNRTLISKLGGSLPGKRRLSEIEMNGYKESVTKIKKSKKETQMNEHDEKSLVKIKKSKKKHRQLQCRESTNEDESEQIST